MKKILFVIGMASLMAACNKTSVINDFNDNTPSMNSTYEFSLKVSAESELTKTEYAGDKTFAWSNGDQISVLFNDGAGNNKFYTLTTSTGGSAAATFTGTIDAGWSVGSSDAKYYALYPAGAHSYTEGSYPVFNIPAETDFSASHFSANLPMIAVSDNGTDYTFKHLTSAIKFTFTNLDVAKVKLTVQNMAGYDLSGNNPIALSGSDYYMKYNAWGSDTRIISYIENVSAKTAVFYIPYRSWDTGFQPKLTLIDANTGYTLKTLTATSSFGSAMASSHGKVTRVPAISVPGYGIPFESTLGIDWYSDASVVSADGDASGVKVIKGIADADYLYLLFGVKKSILSIDPSFYRSNNLQVYFNSASPGHYGYLYRAGAPLINDASSSYHKGGQVVELDLDDTVFCELKIDRTYDASLSATGTVDVKVCVFYDFVVDSAWNETADWNKYKYSPEITVTLP